MTRILTGTVLALLLTACHLGATPTSSTTETEPLILRSYDVPSAYAAEINSVVRQLLRAHGDEKNTVGSSSLGPGGRLLVAAPESFQRGVKELVEGLNAKHPVPPASVTTESWVVVARPAAKPVPLTPALAEVAPALDAVTKAQGPLEFALMEKVLTSGLSGGLSRTHGAHVELESQGTVFDDRIVADLRINPPGGAGLSTRVTLPANKLLVIGQSGYSPTPDVPFWSKDGQAQDMSLFYVIRVSVAGGA